MPAKSRAQQRALYAKRGAAWVKEHHFDRLEGKPKPAGKRKRK